MFSSNSLDKNCVGSDNCSSGRNNAARFPVGMTSLGDENQQIRIQLAVHKYNSSTDSQLNTRCSNVSPVRHSFLKNSLKAKNIEGDTERTSKGEKQNGNKYEGVGAFPTIHLKKSAVRYRPIRRFSDVKIPYPELPVNRFLSHLPDVNSDMKSSARSVLDVLEDLSGKKIHSNEESKPKIKGLGGDYLPNANAVYKPLFVQKPRTGSVLTRDNTTQTLSSADLETPSPQASSSFMRNDASDPRAELRRKLAKQNNEIFASLSSSISSSFAIKRKIDKVLQAKDNDHVTEGSLTKKSKMSDHQYKNCSDSGDSKTLTMSKVKSSDSMKSSRKNKLNEANSPTSPNKDRLTTIFLDMQNTSPKAQMFENNSKTVETSVKKFKENGLGAESILNNGFVPAVNTFKNKPVTPLVNDISDTNTNGSDLKNSPSASLTEKVDSSDPKKEEGEHQNKPTFDFPVNKANSSQNDAGKSSPSGFQFDGNGTNTSNCSFQKTSIGDDLSSSDSSKNAGNGNNIQNMGNDVQVLSKPFTSRSSNVKPDFSSFKFGAEESVSPTLNVPPKDTESPKSQISKVLNSATTTSSGTPQFHFGTTATVTTSSSVPSAVDFGAAVSQNTVTSPIKPLFTFGQNASLGQQTFEIVRTDEKVNSSAVSTSCVTSATQNIQSGAFNFGQKLTTDSSEIISDKNATSLSASKVQSNITGLSSVATTASTNSTTTTQNDKSLFTFGKKEETVTTSVPVTTSQEQKFTFSFGQKPDTGQNKPPEGFEQKNSNLFSFGQNSTVQELSRSTTVATNVTSPSQASTSQPASLFGHNVPQTTGTPQATFGQISSPQPMNGFGTKSEAGSLSSMTAPASSQNSQNNTDFTVKTPLFAPSSTGFGTASTKVSNGFGTTTSTVTGFKFGVSTTTQSTPSFGVSSAPQTVPVFGASSNSQSTPTFGSSSTIQSSGVFGAPTSSSTSTFGVSRQTPFTFGVSSSTQTAPSFGTTSTTQSAPTFGTSSTSQSTSTFGIPPTTQSASLFGASSSSLTTSGFGNTSTTQSTSAFGGSPGFGVSSSQPTTAFGAPPSTQPSLRFATATAQDNTNFGVSTGFGTAPSTLPNNSFGPSTATSTSGFNTSQASFTQAFGSKPPATSLGQTSGIFGQTPVSSFSSNTSFSSNQNSVFGQKSNTEGSIFDQNKIQTPGFGTAAQPFATQEKFSFGMSTSNATGFTNSPPNTTAAPVFSFSGNPTGNTFTFGSNTSGSNNTQTPFAFKNPANEPFKFGASMTKEGSGFGGTSTSTFTFSGQMNNNAIAEQKPAFNFGSAQVSSSSPFNFGTTPSPSVFSFGGSTSSASSGSSFNFGTPAPGGPFGQTAAASSGAPFAVPGTFSIGSGSSQSRPRATSRTRRRP